MTLVHNLKGTVEHGLFSLSTNHDSYKNKLLKALLAARKRLLWAIYNTPFNIKN